MRGSFYCVKSSFLWAFGSGTVHYMQWDLSCCQSCWLTNLIDSFTQTIFLFCGGLSFFSRLSTGKVTPRSQLLFYLICFIAQQMWISVPQLGRVIQVAIDVITYFFHYWLLFHR